MASTSVSRLVSPTVLALAAVLVALAALGVGLANSSAIPAARASIEVNATGSATGAPDTLDVHLAVTTTASSAAKALNRNNTEMHHLQAVFVGSGVAVKDLQTENLQVSPSYDQNGKISGYQAEDDLDVTLHNLAKSGAVIDVAQNAVGNDVAISSIEFSFSKNAPLLHAARLAAMSQARSEAADLAQGAGASLGPVQHISVSSPSPVPTPLPFGANASSAGVKASVPIRPGTQSVSVSVDVIYDLG